MQDGVPVLSIQGLERRAGCLIRRKGSIQILRNGHGRLACVGGVPAAIGLSAFDLSKTAGAHATFLGQSCHMIHVSCRPQASLAAGSAALLVRRGVDALHLPIDPPAAQGLIQCLGIGE